MISENMEGVIWISLKRVWVLSWLLDRYFSYIIMCLYFSRCSNFLLYVIFLIITPPTKNKHTKVKGLTESVNNSDSYKNTRVEEGRRWRTILNLNFWRPDFYKRELRKEKWLALNLRSPQANLTVRSGRLANNLVLS